MGAYGSGQDLAVWLRSRAPEDIAAMIERRPEVQDVSPVRDINDLASRLAYPWAVTRCLEQLTLPSLQILEVLVALGRGATVDRVTSLVGGEDQRASVVRTMGTLLGLGVIWPLVTESEDPRKIDPLGDGNGGDSRRFVAPRAIHTILPSPLGLGPPVQMVVEGLPVADLQRIARVLRVEAPKRRQDLTDAICAALAVPEAVQRAMESASLAVRRSLTGLVADLAGSWAGEPLRARCGGPFSVRTAVPWSAQAGVGCAVERRAGVWAAMRWAADHGIAFTANQSEPVLPSEVALALLDPTTVVPFDPAMGLPITVAVEGPPPAGNGVTETFSVLSSIFDRLTREPITMLRAGGVGTREIARIVKSLRVTADELRLALELGVWGGILAEIDGVLTVSEGYDGWRRLPVAERIVSLLTWWKTVPEPPTAAIDVAGAHRPVLMPTGMSSAASIRLTGLSILGSFPDGLGTHDLPGLNRAVSWFLPLVSDLDGILDPGWAEAGRLGLIEDGRLTRIGDALIDGDHDALAKVVGAAVPSGQSIFLGSDLTIIAAGVPDARAVELLDDLADREQVGLATTWRMSASSVRRALDGGWAAADLLTRLREVADAAIPQAMEYLIADVARRHGEMQVFPAATVVVCDTEVTAREISIHRAVARSGLRIIAPTVLLSRGEPSAVLRELREAGYMPVAVDADGQRVVQVRSAGRVAGSPVAVGRPANGRAWTATGAGPSATSEGRDEGSMETARRLLTGQTIPQPPRQADERRRIKELKALLPNIGARQVYELLRADADAGTVWIRYRAKSGAVTDRVVTDVELDPPYMYGWCELRDDDRMFLLSGVLDVRRVG